MNIQEEKARIRKEIRRRRKLLSSKVLSEIDRSLPEFIAAIDDPELKSRLKKAKRIALYRPLYRRGMGWTQDLLWKRASHAASRRSQMTR